MNSYSYQMYELAHVAMAPARAWSDATRLFFKNPMNPYAHTSMGKNLAAMSEMFERVTRRYGKPIFGLETTQVGGRTFDIVEQVVWERPFVRLLHFQRLPLAGAAATLPNQPKLLIVAPVSGHYATLLRGTVEAFLPHFDVYITDWADARMVPLAAGRFDLDDYIDHLIDMVHVLGHGVHTLGVCQPSVPLIAAVARMAAMDDAFAPASMTLMGGPIDTRRSPTAVNTVAHERSEERRVGKEC